MQDRAQLSLEQQLKVIALRHDLLAKMDEILQDRKRMIATLQVCSHAIVLRQCLLCRAWQVHGAPSGVLDRDAAL